MNQLRDSQQEIKYNASLGKISIERTIKQFIDEQKTVQIHFAQIKKQHKRHTHTNNKQFGYSCGALQKMGAVSSLFICNGAWYWDFWLCNTGAPVDAAPTAPGNNKILNKHLDWNQA